MKRSLVGLGLILVSVCSVRADLVMVQKVEGIGSGKSAEMTLKVKDGKMRADVSPEVSTITDMNSGATTTLMHSQKMYMEISAEATQQLMEQMQKMRGEAKDKAAPVDKPSPLQTTGKHERLNGYDTEIYTSQIGAVKVTYWIAKDYPNADKLREVFKQMQKSAMVRLAKGIGQAPVDFPGVPVKTEMTPQDGRTITTTVVSVKEQPLDDAEFSVPAGYQSMPMPSFGAGPGQ
ncbi:MAG: DUF4412 domain-containing protein [Verrucomicrobiota bacterium]